MHWSKRIPGTYTTTIRVTKIKKGKKREKIFTSSISFFLFYNHIKNININIYPNYPYLPTAPSPCKSSSGTCTLHHAFRIYLQTQIQVV